jgi:hypothetical protein
MMLPGWRFGWWVCLTASDIDKHVSKIGRGMSSSLVAGARSSSVSELYELVGWTSCGSDGYFACGPRKGGNIYG